MEDEYIPGVCNIGKAEIARRLGKLRISLMLLSLLTPLLFLVPLNLPILIIIAVIAGYASILLFQIRQKFCIVFGWMSVFNFKNIGEKKGKNENQEWIRMDRMQTLKILAYSALSTVLFIAVLVVLKKVI